MQPLQMRLNEAAWLKANVWLLSAEKLRFFNMSSEENINKKSLQLGLGNTSTCHNCGSEELHCTETTEGLI